MTDILPLVILVIHRKATKRHQQQNSLNVLIMQSFTVPGIVKSYWTVVDGGKDLANANQGCLIFMTSKMLAQYHFNPQTVHKGWMQLPGLKSDIILERKPAVSFNVQQGLTPLLGKQNLHVQRSMGNCPWALLISCLKLFSDQFMALADSFKSY